MDAWVHFSVIETDGFATVKDGDEVDFDYEAAHQDSFRYRATRVLRVGRQRASPGGDTRTHGRD